MSRQVGLPIVACALISVVFLVWGVHLTGSKMSPMLDLTPNIQSASIHPKKLVTRSRSDNGNVSLNPVPAAGEFMPPAQTEKPDTSTQREQTHRTSDVVIHVFDENKNGVSMIP